MFSVVSAVFHSQASYLQSTQLSELEDRDGELNKLSVIQKGKQFSNVLLDLDCHKSIGPDRIHLRVLRELVEVIAKLFSSFMSSPGQLGRSQIVGDLQM